MNVLVACEYSGIVRDAFTSAGHNATSCDIIPSLSPGQHIIGDAFEVAYFLKWDLIIAHPPCTYLCKAQGHLVLRSFERSLSQASAVKFFRLIMEAPCPLICCENPRGALTRLYRPPDDCIHPYMFGDPYQKEISLWLKGLPPLIRGALSPGRKRVQNHTNSRMSQDQKSKIHSKFFPGIAAAMAQQWG